ncbi:MAG: hypothetical protein ACOYMG_25815, partial [Candidatus Methylumidiphilus sp.]
LSFVGAGHARDDTRQRYDLPTFFVGMAHSYGIVATNLMLVKQELGNQPKKHCPPGFFSFALRRCAFA